MADSENTAVNDLIARISGGQTSVDPAEVGHEMGTETIPLGHKLGAEARPIGHEMGVETIPVGPRSRVHGALDPMHTTIPASMPVAAPFEGRAAGVDGRAAAMQSSYPVASRAPAEPAPAAESTWRPRRVFGNGEHLVGTLQLSRKKSDVRVVVHKLIVPISLLVLAGVLIGAFIALRGPSPVAPAPVAAVTPAPVAITPAPVAAAVIAPAPAAAVVAPAPIVAPVAAAAVIAPAPVVTPVPVTAALVDVRIDSTPTGATVTLVDRGKPQIVGETPIAAAIDPTREYDLVLTYAGKPTRTVHFDPRSTRRLAIELAAPAAAPPRREPEPARREPVRHAEPAPVRRAEPAGEGTLMISSKPPCEIVIDGKPTGLTTPQRAIALPAGRHKVTLINSEKDLRKTLSVDISADETAKIIEDLMQN